MNHDEVIELAANVDDMDPRLWPHVVERLLAVGALDAWTTAIGMKKGRPAIMLSALCNPADAAAVRNVFFTHTSTIGVREHTVGRHLLDRRFEKVEVRGERIAVKVSSDADVERNRSVEWDDVIRAAESLGLSPKDVLAAASAKSTETTSS